MRSRHWVWTAALLALAVAVLVLGLSATTGPVPVAAATTTAKTTTTAAKAPAASATAAKPATPATATAASKQKEKENAKVKEAAAAAKKPSSPPAAAKTAPSAKAAEPLKAAAKEKPKPEAKEREKEPPKAATAATAASKTKEQGSNAPAAATSNSKPAEAPKKSSASTASSSADSNADSKAKKESAPAGTASSKPADPPKKPSTSSSTAADSGNAKKKEASPAAAAKQQPDKPAATKPTATTTSNKPAASGGSSGGATAAKSNTKAAETKKEPEKPKAQPPTPPPPKPAAATTASAAKAQPKKEEPKKSDATKASSSASATASKPASSTTSTAGKPAASSSSTSSASKSSSTTSTGASSSAAKPTTNSTTTATTTTKTATTPTTPTPNAAKAPSATAATNSTRTTTTNTTAAAAPAKPAATPAPAATAQAIRTPNATSTTTTTTARHNASASSAHATNTTTTNATASATASSAAAAAAASSSTALQPKPAAAVVATATSATASASHPPPRESAKSLYTTRTDHGDESVRRQRIRRADDIDGDGEADDADDGDDDDDAATRSTAGALAVSAGNGITTGTVLVATVDGALHALDLAAGTHLWSVQQTTASPPTGGSGSTTSGDEASGRRRSSTTIDDDDITPNDDSFSRTLPKRSPNKPPRQRRRASTSSDDDDGTTIDLDNPNNTRPASPSLFLDDDDDDDTFHDDDDSTDRSSSGTGANLPAETVEPAYVVIPGTDGALYHGHKDGDYYRLKPMPFSVYDIAYASPVHYDGADVLVDKRTVLLRLNRRSGTISRHRSPTGGSFDAPANKHHHSHHHHHHSSEPECAALEDEEIALFRTEYLASGVASGSGAHSLWNVTHIEYSAADGGATRKLQPHQLPSAGALPRVAASVDGTVLLLRSRDEAAMVHAAAAAAAAAAMGGGSSRGGKPQPSAGGSAVTPGLTVHDIRWSHKFNSLATTVLLIHHRTAAPGAAAASCRNPKAAAATTEAEREAAAAEAAAAAAAAPWMGRMLELPVWFLSPDTIATLQQRRTASGSSSSDALLMPLYDLSKPWVYVHPERGREYVIRSGGTAGTGTAATSGTAGTPPGPGKEVAVTTNSAAKPPLQCFTANGQRHCHGFHYLNPIPGSVVPPFGDSTTRDPEDHRGVVVFNPSDTTDPRRLPFLPYNPQLPAPPVIVPEPPQVAPPPPQSWFAALTEKLDYVVYPLIVAALCRELYLRVLRPPAPAPAVDPVAVPLKPLASPPPPVADAGKHRLPEALRCVVCDERERSIRFDPCTHVVTCKVCGLAPTLLLCPESGCAQSIKQRKRVPPPTPDGGDEKPGKKPKKTPATTTPTDPPVPPLTIGDSKADSKTAAADPTEHKQMVPATGTVAALVERYSTATSTDGGVTQSIGKLSLTTHDVLGTGSSGTIVYAGTFGGRAVAVKRLVKPFFGASHAEQEIALLIQSDHHPNVVRYFAKEEDANFIYLALEMCCGSLGDLIEERAARAAQRALELATARRNSGGTGGVRRRRRSSGARKRAAAANAASGSAALASLGDSKTPPGSGPPSDDEADDKSSSAADVDSKSGAAEQQQQQQQHESPVQQRHNELRQSRMKRWPELNLDLFDDTQVLANMLSGLAHLHALNIVHRDLKPQNILLTPAYKGKIADMGLGKQLEQERSSFDSLISGSVGWQAPEILHKDNKSPPPGSGSAGGSAATAAATTTSTALAVSSASSSSRLTKAVDIFSAGCVAYYVLTRGKHPFGDTLERESNITKQRHDLRDLAHLPEAHDLVASMIAYDPAQRVTADDARHHPFFWSAEKKLHFLGECSDRFEAEPADGALRLALESRAREVLGVGGSSGHSGWNTRLAESLIDNLGKYRKYDFASVRDLMRVIRNKKNHYRDLPAPVQQLLGPLPDGFLQYFTSRFPLLLMHTYTVMAGFCTQHAPPPVADGDGDSKASPTKKPAKGSGGGKTHSPVMAPMLPPSTASVVQFASSVTTVPAPGAVGAAPVVTFREYFADVSEKRRLALSGRIVVPPPPPPKPSRGWWPTEAEWCDS